MRLALLLALLSYVHADNCIGNCSTLVIEGGYLVEQGKRTHVGTKWSQIQPLIDAKMPDVGPLPGLDANDTTMRYLKFSGRYYADATLKLPSRVHMILNGSVTPPPSGLPGSNDTRVGLIQVQGSFVSVTGGTYTCDGNVAYAIDCDRCSDALFQNLTASGCAQGNLHLLGGTAVEIRFVDSYGSNRGVWSQTPSSKNLITDSFFHDNSADGVDLDSFSAHVMIKNNRFENNRRCGVFVEEGASSNYILDNIFFNNSFGVGFYTNLGGRDPGKYPTRDNWVVGNTFLKNGGAISLGGMRGNGATATLIAQNKIQGNGNGFGANGALVGNHVLTSDTTDARSARYDGYGTGNVTFFAEPTIGALAGISTSTLRSTSVSSGDVAEHTR